MKTFPNVEPPHPLFWEPLLQKVRFGINFFYDFGWPLYQVTLRLTGVNVSVVQRIGKQSGNLKSVSGRLTDRLRDAYASRNMLQSGFTQPNKFRLIIILTQFLRWRHPCSLKSTCGRNFRMASSCYESQTLSWSLQHVPFSHGPQAGLTWQEPWRGRDTSAKVWIITSISCIQSIAKPTIMSSTWLWNSSESYIWI